MPKTTICKTFKFDAAHRLPRVDEGHKCGNLHGHTFAIEVHLEGEIDGTKGWLLDFNELCAAVEPEIDRLDHAVLNEVEGLENPTSENLAAWFWDRLAGRLPQLSLIVVRESPSSACFYDGR